MPSFSRSHRFISLIYLALFATVLVGCDERRMNSRQEAEDYAKSHPDVSIDKILIRNTNDSETSLQDARTQEQAQARPNQPDTKPANADQTGEVLKYEEPAAQTPVELFNVNSIMAVSDGGTSPTVKFDEKTHISELSTYHWNGAKGKEPGTIGLRDENGKTYGPWPATSSAGQGGAPNVYWKTTPNIDLPAGSYTVIDSDPATWSQNSETNGQGVTWAKGWRVE